MTLKWRKEQWWSTLILIHKLFHQLLHERQNVWFLVQLFWSCTQNSETSNGWSWNKGQGHLRLAEIRWLNVLHCLAKAFLNDDSKFCQFEEIAKWNSDCLFLKMKGYGRLVEYCNTAENASRSVVRSWCTSWQTTVWTFIYTAPWHNAVQLRWMVQNQLFEGRKCEMFITLKR